VTPWGGAVAPLQERRGRAAGEHGAPCNIARPHYCAGTRYQKSIFNCKKIIPSVDRLYVYDNSVEDQDASLLFRMSDGKLVKSYTENIPQWAMTILK
jgi:predicted ABC-type ATPase